MTELENATGPDPDDPVPPPIFAETVEAGRVDAEPAPAARPRPRPAPRPQRTSPIQDVEREIELNEAMDLRDLLSNLGGDTAFKITITRKSPRVGPGGENVYGALETVEEMIDDEYIRETWGGGVFSIMIQTANTHGKFKILRRIQLKLAGPPKMHGMTLGNGNGHEASSAHAGLSNGRDPLVQMAFESAMDAKRTAEERMIKLQEGHGRQQQGLDTAAIATLSAPYARQIDTLMETVRDLQGKLADLGNKPPTRDEFRDNLMTSVISGDRSEADRVRKLYEDRLETQRAGYERRIDDMIRAGREDLKRVEDRHADMIRSIESRHEREVKAAEKQHDHTGKNTDIAYQARLDAQKETIERLNRELTQSASKIGTLEAKKDQSIADKANELLSVQEALEGLGGGGGDKDEKWWSKALDVLGNSEAAMAVVNKLTGGSPEQIAQQQQPIVVQQQQQQLPPPGVPWEAPDGNVYVRDQMGQVHQLDPAKVNQAKQRLRKKKKKAKAAARAAANGAPPVEGAQVDASEAPDAIDDGLDDEDDVDDEPAAPVGRPPSAEDVQTAITFMESAIKGNAPPDKFAATARSLVPADVLTWIMQFETIDQFLNQTKLSSGSPLTTVGGRRFARAVHKFLKEGSL